MRQPFNGSFAITQRFGDNPASYSRFGMRGHNGVDYALPSGTPVLAATAGKVYFMSDPGGFGVWAELWGSQYRTIYAHLMRRAVENGATVAEGQLIAYSDNTGNSTGPHLHFGVKPLSPNVNNGFFGAIDPLPLLSAPNTNLGPRLVTVTLPTLQVRTAPTTLAPGNQANTPDGVLHAGMTVQVVRQVAGQRVTINGVTTDQWGVSIRGHYFWMGGVK